MLNKIKLLVVLPVSWGGIVHSTLAVTEQLCNEIKNIDIVILKTRDKYSEMFKLCPNVMVIDELHPILFSRDRPFLAINPRNIVNIFIDCIRMKTLIRKINPDLIYLVAPYPQFLCTARELKQRKVILTVHAIFPQVFDVIRHMGIFNGLIYFLTEVTLKALNPYAIIVHTFNDANLIRKKFVLNSKIMKASLPILGFNNLCIKPYKIVKRKLVFLYFGYIVPGKGINVLLKALEKVCTNPKLSSSFLVLIVGKGNIPKRSLSLVQKKCNVIVINTYVPEKYIPIIFSYADVVVLPYVFHKGFSGVLRLAIEYSKPLLASNAGDLPEIVEMNKIGILFKKNNWMDLASKMEYILNNNDILGYLQENIKLYKKKIKLLSYTRIFKKILNEDNRSNDK